MNLPEHVLEEALEVVLPLLRSQKEVVAQDEGVLDEAHLLGAVIVPSKEFFVIYF